MVKARGKYCPTELTKSLLQTLYYDSAQLKKYRNLFEERGAGEIASAIDQVIARRTHMGKTTAGKE